MPVQPKLLPPASQTKLGRMMELRDLLPRCTRLSVFCNTMQNMIQS